MLMYIKDGVIVMHRFYYSTEWWSEMHKNSQSPCLNFEISVMNINAGVPLALLIFILLVCCGPFAIAQKSSSKITSRGPCMSPEKQYWAHEGSDMPQGDNNLIVERTGDLDFDGTDDVFVGHIYDGGSGGLYYSVFASQDGCWLRVGEGLPNPVLGFSQSNGLIALHGSFRFGWESKVETEYRFDGVSYQPHSAYGCTRKEYEDGEVSDFECESTAPSFECCGN